MKLYLAGPMRGIPDFNFPAFDAATTQLRAVGHEVFNPAEHDRARGGMPREYPLEQWVRESLSADIAWLLKYAEAVVILEGWHDSLGARAEVAVAEAIGIPVKPMREMGVAW